MMNRLALILTTSLLGMASIPSVSAGDSRPSFGFPLKAQHQLVGDFAVHSICQYVDHGAGTSLKDYECGGWTYDTHDGEGDRNCAGCAGCTANKIYVEHGDGSTAQYAHLKEGSLTSKSVGDTVEQGEVLGTVGASGDVWGGPHPHFEVRDANGNLIDPFFTTGG